MPALHVAAAVFWIGVAAAFAAGGMRLGLGTLTRPGPGLFPTLAALSIILPALGLIARILSGREGVRGERDAGRTSGKVAWTVAVLVGFAVAVTPLGFGIALALLLAVLLHGIGRVPWPTTVVYALVTSVVVMVLFRGLLGLPLTLGPLEPLLGAAWTR